MISAATIAALEERGLDYILGARERGTAVVREVVLKSEKPFTPLLIERGRGDTQLFVKQVTVGGARYIVCRNEAEVERDRADRQAIVAGLEKRLASGDKALIGNRAYRRYLRKTGTGAAFEIDVGKLADEARFDGIFVLRTNARIRQMGHRPFAVPEGMSWDPQEEPQTRRRGGDTGDRSSRLPWMAQPRQMDREPHREHSGGSGHLRPASPENTRGGGLHAEGAQRDRPDLDDRRGAVPALRGEAREEKTT